MSQQDADAAAAPQTDAAEASEWTTGEPAQATTGEAEATHPDSAAAADEDSTDNAEASEDNDAAAADGLDQWKSYARKHERRAEKAEKSLRQLQEQVANQDSEIVEHQQSVARERLATALARSGVAEQDAATLIEHIDPMRLLADGAPSTEAISQVARSLSVTTHPRAGDTDVDQGKRSDVDGLSADQWIRNQARPR